MTSFNTSREEIDTAWSAPCVGRKLRESFGEQCCMLSPEARTACDGVKIRKSGIYLPDLRDAIESLVQIHGMDPALARGISNYVWKYRLVNDQEDVQRTAALINAISQAVKGGKIARGAAFLYLPHASTFDDNVLTSAGCNARFLAGHFGPELFSERDRDHIEFFKAPIGEGRTYLSCVGGSGAGTFSLDFAIGVEQGGYPSAQLWRTGIDFARLGGRVVMRMVRTGSGCKRSDANYEMKYEEFRAFRRKFGVSPQRALGFLLLQLAYDLGVDHVTALTTTGATKLSSMSKTAGGAKYTELFRGMGLSGNEDECWMSTAPFPEGFFSTQYSSRRDLDGMEAHEAGGIAAVCDAFRSLSSPMTGRTFPCGLHDRVDDGTNRMIIRTTMLRNAALPLPPADEPTL